MDQRDSRGQASNIKLECASRVPETQDPSCSGANRAGRCADRCAEGRTKRERADPLGGAGKKRARQGSNKAVGGAASTRGGWIREGTTDLTVADVFEMTKRIVVEYTEGMPRPKPDGTLEPGTGQWSGTTEDTSGSLPFMTLPRTRYRALKRKPVGGWDKAAWSWRLPTRRFRQSRICCLRSSTERP